MSIFAASVCKKNGDPIFSRQFVELESTRVHELMSVYPRLLQSDSPHTILEENGVRYLYEPLDDIFVVLLSDASTANILEDIKVLRLLTQLVKTLSEPSSVAIESQDVVEHLYTIIDAFDEVVSMGYSEDLTADQVLNFLAMDSHEEKIQEIIQRNKQLEAAEERKRRAKEFELQRSMGRGIEQEIYGGSSGMGSGYNSSANFSSGFNNSSNMGAPDMPSVSSSMGASQPASSVFTGKGMRLGQKPTTGSNDASLPLLADPEPIRSKPAVPAAPASTTTDITVAENLYIEMTRDGNVKTSRVNGTLNLFAGDRSQSKLKIHSKIDGNASDFKPHPKMDRASFTSDHVLGLKKPEEELPASNVLLVKWAVDNITVPILISCWVSESSDPGFMTVTLEYEISQDFKGTLEDVLIKVPLPTPNAHAADPETSFEQTNEHMIWILKSVSLENEPTGSFEFTAEADHEDDFYPIEVEFSTKESSESDLFTFGKIDIDSVVSAVDGTAVEFNKVAKAQTASYIIR